MQLVSLLSWWYSGGVRRMLSQVRVRFAGLLDYFSIDLLIRTLFAPFRQISAGSVNGPIGLQIRAFFDQLISRVIGSVVRTIVILVGCIAIILQGIVSAIYILLWLAMPLVPIVGLIMMLVGWIPWTLKL